jgi:hypothetical protein
MLNNLNNVKKKTNKLVLTRVLKQQFSWKLMFVKGLYIPNYRKYSNDSFVKHLTLDRSERLFLWPFTSNELFQEKEIKPQRLSKKDFNLIQSKTVHLEYPSARYNANDILKQLYKRAHIFGFYFCEFQEEPPLESWRGVHTITFYLEISEDSVNYFKESFNFLVSTSTGEHKMPLIKKTFNTRAEALEKLNSLTGKKGGRFKYTEALFNEPLVFGKP